LTSSTFDRAGEDDVPLVLELMREFYDFEHLAWDEDASRSGLLTLIAEPALGGVWLVRVDGDAAGYMVLTFAYSVEFRGRFGFLDELYLRERFRGQGLGRSAVRHAESICAAAGARALRLEVTAHNTRAHGFYAALGFEDHGRTILTRWVADEEGFPAGPARAHGALSKQKALDILMESRDELLAMGVKSLGLFGSVARDEAVAKSDVDVLVDLGASHGFFSYAKIMEFLEERLKRNVDLATPGAIRPEIASGIERDLIRII
jgi:predicted nucleotidyltransferase/ribosomal protein S18 acetylase RimI-like enzyme